MSSALPRFRSGLLSALVAMLAVLPPAGLSLCIGSNGHLVVEWSAAEAQPEPCCESPSPAMPDESCAEDDCASCLDVPLGPDTAMRSKAASAAALPAQVVAPASHPAVLDRGACSRVREVVEVAPPPGRRMGITPLRR